MEIKELFDSMSLANFRFTKPNFEHEKSWHNKQRESLNKLIACGLVKQITKDSYSLTRDGKEASIVGIKKWCDNLNDINRKDLINHSFGFLKDSNKRPSIKTIAESINNSTISKSLWGIIKGVAILIIAYTIWALFKDSIINYFKNRM
ncbi:hypothetical protein Q2T41_18000 [Maribacter confluentis]|uniref:Uncharacterized protein n=1 Tax=Maribacter confluentis TaxID=1656093 RepID=A0ABT8RUG3_9FLAO|nr:hypothetical protein [Maribacter confluentis]MDO1514551.1 hypothetical protein [Maribacter confluentis]